MLLWRYWQTPASAQHTMARVQIFLIPNSLLNATGSGLTSRSIYREDLLAPDDFHGTIVYHEFAQQDQSQHYVDTISASFETLDVQAIRHEAIERSKKPTDTHIESSAGFLECLSIVKELELPRVKLFKPGIGETTRVLLRRLPEVVLVSDMQDPDVAHILELAHEKQVPVRHYDLNCYRSIGVIKHIAKDTICDPGNGDPS